MNRQSNFVRTGLINIAFQVLWLLAFFSLGGSTALTLPPLARIVVLLGVVLVPSAIWTLFFYLQDRVEPEPTGHVIVAFLAGMAGAALLGLPLQKLFHVSLWMYSSLTQLAKASIFVVGATASVVIYFIIRFGFVPNEEFDEPADSLVYGAFIGSGYAFVVSLQYLAAHPDFTLFAIAFTASMNILVYASIGALVGFFVGRAKFGPVNNTISSIIGVVLGMVGIGVYHVLNEFVLLNSADNAFLYSAILTIGFSGIILMISTTLVRRLSVGEQSGLEKDTVPEWGVLTLIVVIFVIAGMVSSAATGPRVFKDDRLGVSFQYPGLLQQLPDVRWGSDNQALVANVLFTGSGGRSGDYRISVKSMPGKLDVQNAPISDFLDQINTTSLKVEPVTIANRKGLRIKYSYLVHEQPGEADYPELRWAVADVIGDGKHILIFSYVAPPQAFEQHYAAYEGLIQSVQWK